VLRGVGRRRRDRCEFRAHGFLVHVPSRSKGSSWTGCSPQSNQARYATDAHPGTNLNSLECVEHHCRERRPKRRSKKFAWPGQAIFSSGPNMARMGDALSLRPRLNRACKKPGRNREKEERQGKKTLTGA